MADEVKLNVGGRLFGGWKSIAVDLSLESMTNAFRLSVTDSWSDDRSAFPVQPGTAAEVLVGDTTVITGYIDEVQNSISDSDRTIEFSGRDKAGDLVDCSADVAGGQFENITLDRLATKLCAPFGITVVRTASVGAPFPKVNINQGETVFEVLEKRARSRGLLLVSRPDGQLEIMSPAQTAASTALEEGVNVKAARVQFSGKERFQTYKVKSQVFSDELGTAGFTVVGKATDDGVKRYRPLVIQAEAQADSGAAKVRAQYEAITRAARSATVSCTVQGWTQRDGSLWAVNRLTKTKIPSIGVDDELLITGVRFSLDATGGTQTTLELKRKDAYAPSGDLKNAKNDLWAKLIRDNSRSPFIGKLSL